MNDIESDIKCLACHVEMPKARVHYGGISCYSCRAFFRRTTQRDDLVRCKFERNCKVEHQGRKSCPPCRYEKCLRAGMRPDLVLDEDDKKRRFKKFKVSKVPPDESDSESVEGEIQVVQDIQRKRTIDNIKIKRRRLKSLDKTLSNSEQISPSLLSSVSPRLPWPQDDGDDSEDQWPALPAEIIKDDENSNECQNDSFLDPETGEVVDIKESQSLSAPQDIDVPKSPGKEDGIEDIGNDDQLFEKVECILDKAWSNSPQRRESREKDFCHLQKTCVVGRIVQHSSSTLAREIRVKAEDELTGDDRIMKYIHKKFDKIENNNQHVDTKHSIKKITIYNKSETVPGQQRPFSYHPNRESVIVKRDEAVAEPQIQIELQLRKENCAAGQNRCQTNEFVFSLNIGDIENIFAIKEEKCFDNICEVFDQKWNAIPFGEEMMNHFIGFCKQRHNLPARFFQLINNQLQERVLNFISSRDDFARLPKSKQFSLLKKNLPKAIVLTKVLGFNMRTWTEEMGFVFTNPDIQQFKGLSYGVEGVKIDELLKYSPFPDAVKRTLLNMMHSCAHPILGDPPVFIMMLMLVIFHDVHDPDICSLHDQYWTMLRRHLTRRPDCCMGVDYLLSSIYNCLRTLPILAQPFRQF